MFFRFLLLLPDFLPLTFVKMTNSGTEETFCKHCDWILHVDICKMLQICVVFYELENNSVMIMIVTAMLGMASIAQYCIKMAFIPRAMCSTQNLNPYQTFDPILCLP